MAKKFPILSISTARRHAAALGFIEGFCGASLFLAGGMPRPKSQRASIAADWKAVGNDMRHAAMKYGKKSAA